MNLRFLEWIWHVRGSVALASDVTRDEVFTKLDPVFQQAGTRYEQTNDTLVFHKQGQAAQDKMSVFDSGVLTLEKGTAGPVLRYDLISRALLYCFLAPVLFLAIAQLTIVLSAHQKAAAEAAEKAGKTPKKPEKKVFPLNPIDQALGAPAPEKPKKDKKQDAKFPSPTPAYVFAGIFAVLYVIGRILEDRLVNALFRKRVTAA